MQNIENGKIQLKFAENRKRQVSIHYDEFKEIHIAG